MEIHRKTKQVQSLLQFFETQTEAIRTSQVIAHFKQSMNRTTVYRILARMEEDGIIHSFKGSDGTTWYANCKDCTHKHHHDSHPHFQCTSCGKVECVEVAVDVPQIPNYKVAQQQILLVGECESCVN